MVSVRWNAVEVALPRASGVETIHTIGRAYFKMAIKPGSPIVIVRKQIPLKHAYAISVNKSQGQTLARVLFDARQLAFSGGQQYVVCSRVRRRGDFAAVVGDANLTSMADEPTLVVANVVYTELLDALAACGPTLHDGEPASRCAGKRPAAQSKSSRAQRARCMDICGACDSDVDMDA